MELAKCNSPSCNNPISSGGPLVELTDGSEMNFCSENCLNEYLEEQEQSRVEVDISW